MSQFVLKTAAFLLPKSAIIVLRSDTMEFWRLGLRVIVDALILRTCAAETAISA